MSTLWLVRLHSHLFTTPASLNPHHYSSLGEFTANKGFWAELLGVGDFYYELGIQIIDACLSTRDQNGGLLEIGELKLRVERMRRGMKSKSDQVEEISEWVLSIIA